MSSRDLRSQRRAAERKQKKLARRKEMAALNSVPQPAAAASPASCPDPNGINPELLDEFTPEFLAEANAIRARVYARAGMPLDSPGRSTGPRSENGKLKSSRNALTHGLASGELIIPGENPADLEALLRSLVREHQPATPTEELLVQRMAHTFWLSQRALRLQTACFAHGEIDTRKLALLLRYQTTHERAFHKALATLKSLKKERSASQPKFVSQNRPDERRTERDARRNPLPHGFVSQNSGINSVARPPEMPTAS